MLRNRKKDSTGSLELLLDTICNIFGGIILLALLIIIQTQISVAQVSEKPSVVTEQHLQMLKLHGECAMFQKEITELKKHIDILHRTHKDNVTENTQSLIELKNNFIKAIEKSSQNLKSIHDQLNYLKEYQFEIKTASVKTDDLIKNKDSQLSELMVKLENSTREITENLRLPHRRIDPQRSQISYLIKGSRVYLFGKRIRWFASSPYESGHCLITPIVRSSGTPAAQINPIKNKGVKVFDDGSSRKFLFTLKDCSPEKYYIMFFVYGDSESFKSFQSLKNIVLDQGFLYGVIAHLPKKDLIVSPGNPSVE
jgi:hypothetical protein